MLKNSFYTEEGILMLRCSTCKKWKDNSHFQKDNAKPRGYSYRCKECQKEIDNLPENKKKNKEYYEANKDKAKAYAVEYMKSNGERVNKRRMERYYQNQDKSKIYYQEHKEEIKKKQQENSRELRNKRLMKNFGISIDEYDKLFELQRGCCAICGRHQSKLKRTLALDHNHANGNNRGLLCYRCNTFLGYCNDNIACFENAINYLKRDGK
jgi:hypothetical protein